jgi:PleD family two-component response regulator
VLEKLESLKILQGNNVLSPITMSIGLAAFSDSNVTGDSLILAADAALYLAKQGGRNRVVTENQSDPAISLGAEITQPQSPYLVIQSS